MWILPKQLHTSAFVPDTEALSLDLNESSQLCAQSLFVRSKPSPLRIWLQKWKRDSWTQHLFGRILKPSHGNSFEIRWTFFLEATPASPSVQPGSDLEQTTQDIFGPTSQAAFAFFDQSSVSLRMLKGTLALDSEKSLENWKSLVTKRRGEYSARLNAARLTSENESSSWPSPVASEVRQGFQDRSRGMKGSQESLTIVVVKSWPTPDTNNHRDGTTLRKDNKLEQGGFHGISLHHAMSKYGLPGQANHSTLGSHPESWATPEGMEGGKISRGGKRKNELLLTGQVKAWATPQSRDAKGAEGRMIRDGKSTDLPSQTEVEQTGAWNRNNGRLNPRWVETLMGVPIGWTMPSCTQPVTIAQTSCAYLETE